ncbi:MAG: glutamine synthetase, partial [Candidatus Puniceispirillum sp.]|nr:glutamine synthetase [Candidatus Puniceispirillum sp.]
PEPVTTSAYALDLPVIPTRWEAAIDRFAESPLIARMLPATLCDMFIDCKRQELQRFLGDVSPFEYHSYLDQV